MQRTRLLNVLIAALLLCGSLAGLSAAAYLLFVDLPNPVAAQSDESDLEELHNGAAELFAASFVDTWLRNEDTGRYSAEPIAMSSTAYVVERVVPLQSTSRDHSTFDVTVVAELIRVLDGSEQSFEQLPNRFYLVGVYVDPDGTATVLGPPAVVAGPTPTPPPTKLIDSLSPASTVAPAIIDPIEGFFSAYLTGTGRIELFTSPGAGISSVNPPVYTAVDVVEVGSSPLPGANDDGILLVRLLLSGTEKLGSQTLEYNLVIAERDGRWEVSQLLTSPFLQKP